MGHTAFIIGGRSGETVCDAKSWKERDKRVNNKAKQRR